jgi:hypothetical protein
VRERDRKQSCARSLPSVSPLFSSSQSVPSARRSSRKATLEKLLDSRTPALPFQQIAAAFRAVGLPTDRSLLVCLFYTFTIRYVHSYTLEGASHALLSQPGPIVFRSLTRAGALIPNAFGGIGAATAGRLASSGSLLIFKRETSIAEQRFTEYRRLALTKKTGR